MIKIILAICIVLSLSQLKDSSLVVKTSKSAYSSRDKLLKWTITNSEFTKKYYLIGLNIKTDTGWSWVRSYIYNLKQKDMLALLEIGPKTKVNGQVQIADIYWERDRRKFSKKFEEYSISVLEFQEKHFNSKYSKPVYTYFKLAP